MTCSINITPSGELKSVLDFFGVESKLFNQIASLPYIQNVEEALDIYIKTQTESFQNNLSEITNKFDTNEPFLEFQLGNGAIVENYYDALVQSAGETINAGFRTNESFIPLHSLNTDLSLNTFQGKINNMVMNNILSPQKIKIGNNYRLQGRGDNLTSISFNNIEALQILNEQGEVYSIENNTIKEKGNKNIISYSPQQISDAGELVSLPQVEIVQAPINSESDLVSENMNALVTRLYESGLAENVFLMDSAGIDNLLQGDPKYSGNAINIKGAVQNNQILLNSETMTVDTPIHEFGHLWNSFVKANNKELYQTGLNLVETQGEQYISFVKQTQPNLEGEALLEEALAQAIGDNGSKLIKSKSNGLTSWLTDLWNYIADAIGISSMSSSDIGKLSLDEFSTAVAIDLLKGRTIEGLMENEPGNGGELQVIPLKTPVVDMNSRINMENYPAEAIVEIPTYSLTDIIKKYKGKIYITTSDATTIGYDSNGELIQGGPGYLTLAENVNEGIGFAALDTQGAKAMGSKVYNIGKGEPVAVLVMVQNPSATLGNGYGGDFLFNSFNQAQNDFSKTKFNNFKKSFKKVVDNMFDKYVKDSVKKGFSAKEHKKKIQDVINNLETTSLTEFHDSFIEDTNFDFRRNLMKTLVYSQEKKSNNPDIAVVREAMRELGFTYENFASTYMDQGVVNSENLLSDKLGVIIGGFEMRTNFSSAQKMTDYVLAAQERGVKHKMFNGKLPSEGNFLLDGGYSVDENFTSYSVPNTVIRKDSLDYVNSLITTWNPKRPEGLTYTDLPTKDSIDFKAYLASFHPETLQQQSSNPSIDIARGLGFRSIPNASEAIMKDFVGTRFSIANDITKDESTFVDFLKNGQWGMLTAQNPNAEQASEETNQRLNFRGADWLRRNGYTPIPIKGNYGNQEDSFLVPNLTTSDAIAFAKDFSQESVATNQGLVFRDGAFLPRIVDSEDIGGEYEDYYSTIKIAGKDLDFQVGYDETMQPREGFDAVSPETKNYLTEDGAGNYIFYHYSSGQFESLDPNKSGSNGKAITNKGETGAWSLAGGVNFLYTKQGDRERVLTGNYGYEFSVPMNAVYDIDLDVNRYAPEAINKFKADNNGAIPNSNQIAALVTKRASESGYQVTLSRWNNMVRGQTNQSLTPSDTLIVSNNIVQKDFANSYESNYSKMLKVTDRYEFDELSDAFNYLQDKFRSTGQLDNIIGISQSSSVDRIMNSSIPNVYKKVVLDLLRQKGFTGLTRSIPESLVQQLDNTSLPSQETTPLVSSTVGNNILSNLNDEGVTSLTDCK